MTDEPQTTQTSPTQKRRIVLITGGLVLAFSLYLLVFLVPDVIKSAAGPQSMSLAHAADIATAEATYATIEDGVWHCDTIVYKRGPSSTNRLVTVTRFTEIFLTDETRPEQTVLLATMSGEMTCADFEMTAPSGYLTQMSSSKRQELTNDARLARFFDAQNFLYFCGYCGTENSFIGAAFGGVIAIAGLVTIVVGLRMPKANQPPNN